LNSRRIDRHRRTWHPDLSPKPANRRLRQFTTGSRSTTYSDAVPTAADKSS
jgi:hypothetical protein